MGGGSVPLTGPSVPLRAHPFPLRASFTCLIVGLGLAPSIVRVSGCLQEYRTPARVMWVPCCVLSQGSRHINFFLGGPNGLFELGAKVYVEKVCLLFPSPEVATANNAKTCDNVRPKTVRNRQANKRNI